MLAVLVPSVDPICTVAAGALSWFAFAAEDITVVVVECEDVAVTGLVSRPNDLEVLVDCVVLVGGSLAVVSRPSSTNGAEDKAAWVLFSTGGILQYCQSPRAKLLDNISMDSCRP